MPALQISPALVAAIFFTITACLAKTTNSFWNHIAAIEARDISGPPSAYQSFQNVSKRDVPTPVGHSSSVKCTHPVPRVSFYSATEVEKQAWIQSFNNLHQPGKSIFIRGGSFMDDLALVHIGLQEELHYNACFLVCHTAFLRAFYSLMRISGYQGRELYWDIESDRQYGMQNAALWQSFGGDDGKGGPIPDGPFRQMKCGVLPNTKKPGYSVIQPHFVTRHFNSDWNRKPMIKGDMYGSKLTSQLYENFMNAPSYTKLRLQLEATIHAWIHQSIGGEMWLFSAVCEPAFWTLHAEIDRLWRSWQFRHNRYFDYEGHRRIRRNDGSTEEKLASLDDTIDFYGLFEKIQVRDVMHPRRGILCYRYDKLVGGGPDNAM
ncbi:uncharacterized protein MEPE_01222 [Melanopsichium pennsylvanicum]|uniref:Tyrosinase copper-binding domain-containing protein n=1 Tax=Melanopsichium pennsylvanicum TaxID=63383 RepID=A0AAJ5C3D7_9BASI|nr:uncharacterized protein MEPE_01222 [Melanopsichium pennsylvanicum]